MISFESLPSHTASTYFVNGGHRDRFLCGLELAAERLPISLPNVWPETMLNGTDGRIMKPPAHGRARLPPRPIP
jgi:hypothetical protein